MKINVNDVIQTKLNKHRVVITTTTPLGTQEVAVQRDSEDAALIELPRLVNENCCIVRNKDLAISCPIACPTTCYLVHNR